MLKIVTVSRGDILGNALDSGELRLGDCHLHGEVNRIKERQQTT